MTWVFVFLLMFNGEPAAEMTVRTGNETVCQALQAQVERRPAQPPVEWILVQGCTPEVDA